MRAYTYTPRPAEGQWRKVSNTEHVHCSGDIVIKTAQGWLDLAKGLVYGTKGVACHAVETRHTTESTQ